MTPASRRRYRPSTERRPSLEYSVMNSPAPVISLTFHRAHRPFLPRVHAETLLLPQQVGRDVGPLTSPDHWRVLPSRQSTQAKIARFPTIFRPLAHPYAWGKFPRRPSCENLEFPGCPARDANSRAELDRTGPTFP
ncbi:hypothetical protein CJ030_MR5G010040 [Morella rubra]|uniref:Protein TAR1 n=1 Tax=Morella rubra TaxID=262757 RepID=A0A6A1VGG2_9ROSI|nr:hypothetical protein CJ030_MR5G010040 [Morella rubra]